MSFSPPLVSIIGGGLAGSEAAWLLAKNDIPVILYEMRPHKTTGAHHTDYLAELVCSNSFRSDDAETSAVGILHRELDNSHSLILQTARQHAVDAGGALAMDRHLFAQEITKKLQAHPLISIQRQECTLLDLPTPFTIMATGPLTSPSLAEDLGKITGEEMLFFFDAMAPILNADSIDFSKAWFQNRYDKGKGKDYVNCPLTEQQYKTFIEEILKSETVSYQDFELPSEKEMTFFEGCLPIEIMAARGEKTLAFGPMKPVGLKNPHSEEQPFAIVQLRKENEQGSLYNMVGFQTKMKHKAQKDVFRMIPGLENASFARLGGIHRNTYVQGPDVLSKDFSLQKEPSLFLAGQITGCEGYVESTASGFMTALAVLSRLKGIPFSPPPTTTAFGGLWQHITGPRETSYTPMNITFGLMDSPPPFPTASGKLKPLKGKEKKKEMSLSATRDFESWLTLLKDQSVSL